MFLISTFLVAGHAGIAAAADPASDKILVRYYATKDFRGYVRAAAWSALISGTPDAAVRAYLYEGGHQAAVKRSEQTSARNADFARRVLATHTVEFAPEVSAAARRAVNGSAAEQESFVRTGFEEARARDRAAREKTGERARALVEADWAYVRNLAARDPGAQVRASAMWAVRPGADAEDLVEFFSYGWASGARLDLDAQRRRTGDADISWRALARRLVGEAEAAEKAAREASGEAGRLAREAAARAWGSVGAQTTEPRSTWADAQESSLRQAENWRAVVAAAAAASGPNWAAVGGQAAANESEWASEGEWAADQSRFWQALLAQALAGEKRMTSV